MPCVLCGSASFVPAFDSGSFAYVRCPDCGLVQINPQPRPEDVLRRYTTGYGEDYLMYENANEKAFLALQKLALCDIGFDEIEKELTAGTEKPKVLDVGSATGALLEELRARGWDVTGVEISDQMAAYAREKRGLKVLREPLEKAFSRAALAASAFDLVHASHLIEHLNDPRSFLEAAAGVLKPRGRLILTTPNTAGFQARVFRGRWRSAIFDHLYLFSPRTLTTLLDQTGFAVEKTKTWGGLASGIGPLPVKRALDFCAKRFGFGDVMVALARKV